MSREMRCEDCGHEFKADMGGEGERFEIYRCNECGRLLHAERTAHMPKMIEEKCGCGGTYIRGRPPKCPRCRTWKVTIIE